MKTAIAFLSKDRPELNRQSLPPLIAAARQGHFHLFIYDGSTTEANERALWELAFPTGHVTANVRGGAGAAIVYALTELLNHKEGYTHVGLVESDVLLLDGWLAAFDLFARGQDDNLEVGAVSARCFTDRVLFQREHYAVMHNIGAGCIVLTREAAKIVLDTFRTAWTTDNRRIFSQLCGVDIAAYWAFKAHEHNLTSDWGWDAALAARGLASLALTPSPCEMIGQVPPLAEQGLHIVGAEPDEFEIPSVTDAAAFSRYCDSLAKVRAGKFSTSVDTKFQYAPETGTFTYFPHQMAMLGGVYAGDWRLRELRGWGTFGWEAAASPETECSVGSFSSLTVPAFGSVAVLISGGRIGGKAEVIDLASGFKASPELIPEGDNGQILALMVPGGINVREIQLTALTPGVVFYGLQSREKQPFLPNVSFDFSTLPPP